MVMSRRWSVAVPQGCALRDGSGLSCPGGCSVALLGAVDRGAPDTESNRSAGSRRHTWSACLRQGTTAPPAHADGGRRVITAVPQWTAHAARTGAPASSDRLHLSMVLNLRDPAGARAR